MRTTIDAAGRVVIPKAFRERLGLTGGETLEVTEADGRVTLEPAASAMRLLDRGSGVVAVPDRDLPPLTDDIVRSTVEQTRR